MKIGPKKISEALYKKILRVMPVPCVDAVIVSGRKFLLGKRANKPARGLWFVIGGRVLKGEPLESAILRHVKAETGAANIKVKRLLTTAPTIFKNSAHGPSTHTINTVFLVSISAADKILPNKENEELKWFSKIDKNWHPYIRSVLRLAGFK